MSLLNRRVPLGNESVFKSTDYIFSKKKFLEIYVDHFTYTSKAVFLYKKAKVEKEWRSVAKVKKVSLKFVAGWESMLKVVKSYFCR